MDRLAAKGKHKSPTESCGREGKKGSAGPPSPTPGRDPRGRRAGSPAASRRRQQRCARPRPRARVPGSGRGSPRRGRLSAPAGPQAGETVRVSPARGSVPGPRGRAAGAPGGKGARTHQVQSLAPTKCGRERTASSGVTASPAGRRGPGALGAAELRHGRPPS